MTDEPDIRHTVPPRGRGIPDRDSWHYERDRLDAQEAAQRAAERGTDNAALQGWPFTNGA